MFGGDDWVASAAGVFAPIAQSFACARVIPSGVDSAENAFAPPGVPINPCGVGAGAGAAAVGTIPFPPSRLGDSGFAS